MNNTNERYQRQIMLPQLGEAGQQKLSEIKILVIGAGGLGCPALLYLAAAGVGTLGIVDHDIVSLNNLHRQVLFGKNDIGSSKAIVARQKLIDLNNDISIISYAEWLSKKLAWALIREYDIIVDCTDNFATRYMVNDACVLLKKTLVYGAIAQFEGQVAVFNAVQKDGAYSANYRDLFPAMPRDNEIRNCAEAGVIGFLPGIIGTMMAAEAIKLVTGIGEPLTNKILSLNVLNCTQHIFNISPIEKNADLLPATEIEFMERNDSTDCNVPGIFTINKEKFQQLRESKDILVVDVREQGEMPIVHQFPVLQIPLSVLEKNIDQFSKENIVLFCQSGKRSSLAAQLLFDTFGTTKNIYSLQNGVFDIYTNDKIQQ